MEKEIAKRFFKGIPASPGIVIGKACVFKDILYLVERRNVEEGHAEQEIVRLKQAIRKVIDKKELSLSEKEIPQELERFLDDLVLEILKMNSQNSASKNGDG